MKNLLKALSLAVAVSAALVGCSSVKSSVELMDSDVDYSVECRNVIERRTADGRMEVAAYVHNKENRRVHIQINCVFKDEEGYPTEGDETTFRTLILAENANEPVTFTAFNNKSKIYTIHIRQAR